MAERETRLGKGLGALLGENVDEETPRGPVRELPVEEIRPNPYQPRRRFDDGRLGELVESIRENGLLQPLVVRPAGEARWEIVAGERRLRALRKLGRERVPVVVRELTDDQMLVLALVENLQRENLSPLEEAAGYRELIEGFGLTQQAVGERVGKDRSTVANALRLLELPEEVKALVDDGSLSGTHARTLLGLEATEDQVALAEEVVEKGLSVRATERRVRRRRQEGERGAGDGESEDPAERATRRIVERAAQAMGRALGTEVSIRLRGKERGEIRVPFHDAEDFERLVDVLAGDEAAEVFDRG